MKDTRQKDGNWTIERDLSGNFTYPAAQIAVLMDLRDELKKLNRVFQCANFLEVPYILREIRKNTTKPERKRKS